MNTTRWRCGYSVLLALLVCWATLVADVTEASEPEVRRQDDERPNVLWLTCEDISPNLGCYGDDYAITPELDRLARQGVRYTQAVGICGVCAVNRSCLITGMYPTTIGSQDMRTAIRLPRSIPTFSELLRKSGYYCTNNVKTDYNFATPQQAWDECSKKAHWRNRKQGQPFFAIFNYTGSHESQIWAENHKKHAETLRRGTARSGPGGRPTVSSRRCRGAARLGKLS